MQDDLPLYLTDRQVEALYGLTRWQLRRQREKDDPPGALGVKLARGHYYPTEAILDHVVSTGVSREHVLRRLGVVLREPNEDA